MVLSVSNQDIKSVGSYLSIAAERNTLFVESASMIKMGVDSIKIDLDVINISKKFGPFGAGFLLDISAKDGKLCLDIKNANVVGIGLFGAIRKKIGDILLKYLNMLPNIMTAEKLEGNILVKIKGVSILGASVSNGVLTLKTKL